MSEVLLRDMQQLLHAIGVDGAWQRRRTMEPTYTLAFDDTACADACMACLGRVKIAGQPGLMFKYSYTDKDGHALSGVAFAVTSPVSSLSYAIAMQALTPDFDAQADTFDKMLASLTIE